MGFRVTGLGFGLLNYPPIMENQMQKIMEMTWKLGEARNLRSSIQVALLGNPYYLLNKCVCKIRMRILGIHIMYYVSVYAAEFYTSETNLPITLE